MKPEPQYKNAELSILIAYNYNNLEGPASEILITDNILVCIFMTLINLGMVV